jgi:hypothetical protein
MKSEILNYLPVWAILLITGVGVMVLGAASRLVIGSNSLQLSYPYNVVVMVAGAILMATALIELLRSRKTADDGIQVEKVEVRSIKIERADQSIRAFVSGRVEPPKQGVRVWIAREHDTRSPGCFHLADKPAITDKNGCWQQLTYLWPEGTFRIHAVVAGRASEAMFNYYRRAYNHARSVYQREVDSAAIDFPGWPCLEELPPQCVSDSNVVTV